MILHFLPSRMERAYIEKISTRSIKGSCKQTMLCFQNSTTWPKVLPIKVKCFWNRTAWNRTEGETQHLALHPSVPLLLDGTTSPIWNKIKIDDPHPKGAKLEDPNSNRKLSSFSASGEPKAHALLCGSYLG